MKIIKDLLLGKCDPTTFMRNYMDSDELHEFVQNLIPKAAIEDPNHEYWKKCILRSGLECYNFDVREMLYSHCGFGERDEEQREIFNTIRALYVWINPTQKCTKMYDDRINFLIELESDCFGGPEVSDIIKTIANEFWQVKPKSIRKKEAKAQIERIFHIQGKVKPRWVHGPQWPMGKSSPMAFVTQKRAENCVIYEFRDVDTGDTRVVKQYY